MFRVDVLVPLKVFTENASFQVPVHTAGGQNAIFHRLANEVRIIKNRVAHLSRSGRGNHGLHVTGLCERRFDPVFFDFLEDGLLDQRRVSKSRYLREIGGISVSVLVQFRGI